MTAAAGASETIEREAPASDDDGGGGLSLRATRPLLSGVRFFHSGVPVASLSARAASVRPRADFTLPVHRLSLLLFLVQRLSCRVLAVIFLVSLALFYR